MLRVVPIEIDAPREVVAGHPVPIRVHIVNNKAGHDFPTGPLDIIQAWVEIEVTDDAGEVVFHSGTVDEKNFVDWSRSVIMMSKELVFLDGPSTPARAPKG